jgi:hypothetical protein
MNKGDGKMINFKKIFVMTITASLLTTSIPVFASTTSSKVVNLTQTQYQNVSSTTIDKVKVQARLKDFVKEGYITQQYANKITALLVNYPNSSSSASSTNNLGIQPNDYYNKSTGADIHLNLFPEYVSFNKAGWNIIKEVINIGGGSATIGFGIAALCGIAVTGPIAAIIGGTIVVANASVNLQFALGMTYATIIL